MCEAKLKRVNEYRLKGFEIGLAKHPDDSSKLFVVAIKGDHVVRLIAEPVEVEYVRKFRD